MRNLANLNRFWQAKRIGQNLPNGRLLFLGLNNHVLLITRVYGMYNNDPSINTTDKIHSVKYQLSVREFNRLISPEQNTASAQTYDSS